MKEKWHRSLRRERPDNSKACWVKCRAGLHVQVPCKGVLESSPAREPEHSAPPPTLSAKIFEVWVFV